MRKTKYPGVQIVAPGTYRVRGKFIDPRTGRTTEVKKIVTAATPMEAAAKRSTLLNGRMRSTGRTRMTVGAFAQSWLEAKSGVVSETTLEGYTNSLDRHVLPALGEFFYDALGPMDVQLWVNRSLQLKTDDGEPAFSRRTVEDWFRVFRNMTRDAIAQLSLQRDPTLRIRFPEDPWTDENDAKEDDVLTTEELHRFLGAMKTARPASYALTLVLGLTGQRFCHASALKWGDVDWQEKVIRFRRKQNRGQVGPISRRKPAPRVVPMVPMLVEALREHKARNAWLARRQSGDGRGTTNEDYLFLSNQGTFRQPSCLSNAFKAALKAAGVQKHITPHGLRYAFNDMLRRSGVDAISARALTGHVTEQMQEHYSSVQLDEKRAAISRLDDHLKSAQVDLQVDFSRRQLFRKSTDGKNAA
jgi:integrase